MSDTGMPPDPASSGGLSVPGGPELLRVALAGLTKLEERMVAALPEEEAPSPELARASLAAALALDRRSDGSGDLLGYDRRSAAALLLMHVSPDELADHLVQPGEEGREPAPGLPWSCLLRGFLGSATRDGTLLDVLAGVGMAFTLRDEPRVAMAMCGGEVLASGSWHEGVNLAAVGRARLVVVVQRSDGGGLSGEVLPHPEGMAAAYGISVETVTGDDLGAVTRAASRAVTRAREGRGPSLLEIRHPPLHPVT